MIGNEHPSALTNMTNLAAALRDQGKYEQAEAIHGYQRIIDVDDQQNHLRAVFEDTEVRREWFKANIR